MRYEVDVATECAPFGRDPAQLLAETQLRPLKDDGIVEREGYRLKVAPGARQLVRWVAAAFDAYLCEGEARHARAV